MTPGGSYSNEVKDDTAFGDTNTDNTSSGQHGQLINFVAGKGNALTPTNTDSSGKPGQVWLVLGILAAAVAVWFMLRKKH